MEYIVIPDKVEDLSLYKEKGINTFILGLENYSINYPVVSLDKIKELSKEYSLFIAFNKNIFNNELDEVLNLLKELAKLNIKGILYYDLGVLNLVLDNKIDLDLVWHQTHMVTNYNTCNFYNDLGVKYAFIANEITLSEIIEINNKTNMELFVSVFGYPIVSHSRRTLLSNYFASIGESKENRTYHLEEKDTKLRIKETKDGASILNGYITNGTEPLFELIKNNISYGVLDMQEIDLELAFSVIDKYLYILNNISNIDESEKEKIIASMNELIGTNTNFFYKKTIFKVKRGDNK